jgi:heme/copper-type cytochrome/quinol oxidase subunit 4
MAKAALATARPASAGAGAASESEVEEEALVPSELDEQTHAEMLMLYHEAVKASSFGKLQQWRSMAIGLIAIIGLGVLGANVAKESFLFRIAEFLAVLVGLSAIYLILFYQFWQNTEREKLVRIMARLSNLARSVRGISSGREASLRRYVVLGFMILVILVAVALMIAFLNQLPAA